MAQLSRRTVMGLPLAAWMSQEGEAVAQPNPEQEAMNLAVDFAAELPPFRALHGVNKGAVAFGGLLSVEAEHKALGVPFVRLHDCHWPNPDVVDMHAVFPHPDADPADPKSYDFALTDEYIASVRATGAHILYRLGESIEHTAHKRYVHPPKSPKKWAEVALGIVRHYNDGWATAFAMGFRIGKFGTNRKIALPCGAARTPITSNFTKQRPQTLKAQFPNIKVGGPAVGYSGKWEVAS